MLSIIPTAEEARKQVDEIQSSLGQKKLIEISEAIKNAIDKMETSCTVAGRLPDPIIKALEAKGYNVDIGGRFDDTYISW